MHLSGSASNSQQSSNVLAVNGLWSKWMKTEAHNVDGIDEKSGVDDKLMKYILAKIKWIDVLGVEGINKNRYQRKVKEWKDKHWFSRCLWKRW